MSDHSDRWSAIKAAERREAFLEDLLERMDIDLACEKVGVSRSWVKQNRKRHDEFRSSMDEILAGFTPTERRLPSQGFPAEDFLRWRELTCAYRDHRTGNYVRAVNNWYQKDAYDKLQTSNRLIVILPPGHIKTTFFSIEYPTWRIMRDRDVRIVAVQKNQDEARKLLGSVSERLTNPDYYDFVRMRLKEQGDAPTLNPLTTWFKDSKFRKQTRQRDDTWNQSAFKVDGRRSGEKDNTMEAKGVGGQIQGVRADLIILDDVQDPELAFVSPADSEKKLGWMERVILGRVTEAQQVVVLANYFAPDDFAHKLKNAHPEFEVVEYPAIIDLGNGPEPLCPEFWTMEALAFKQKEVGPRTWHYTWMQEEASFEGLTFKREVLEASREPGVRVGEVPHSVTDLFLGVDPAIAASGYCAMVLWGLDRKSKQRWLIDVFNKTGMRNWDNVVAQILEYASNYPLRQVIIEKNNTQQSLAYNPQLEREVRSRGAKIQVYQTVTGTGARAEQTNFDITTVGSLWDAGLVSICYGGTFEEQKRIDDYIDQLCTWRTDQDGHSIKHLVRDMVMATLFAESEAFVVANRPDRIIQQKSSRVPGFAKMAWRRGKESNEEPQTMTPSRKAKLERAAAFSDGGDTGIIHP